MEWLVVALYVVGGMYVLGFILTLIGLIIHLINWASTGGHFEIKDLGLALGYSFMWPRLLYYWLSDKFSR